MVAQIINDNMVHVIYDVNNPTESTQYVKLGSTADTQLGENDNVPVYVTNNGIKMQDGDKVMYISLSDRQASGKWIGHCNQRRLKIWTSQEVNTTYNGDSSVAWHWDCVLAAGESHQFYADITAGNYHTVEYVIDDEGFSPSMVSHGAYFTPVARKGYVLKWYTNSNLTGDAYEGGIVNSDMTLYGKWVELTEADLDISNAKNPNGVTYIEKIEYNENDIFSSDNDVYTIDDLSKTVKITSITIMSMLVIKQS